MPYEANILALLSDTRGLQSGRGPARPRASCPECGRGAMREIIETWNPAAGWRRIEQTRCTGTAHHDINKRCGKVVRVSETTLDRPAPTGDAA